MKPGRLPLILGGVNAAGVTAGTSGVAIQITNNNGPPFWCTHVGVRWASGNQYSLLQLRDTQHSRIIYGGSFVLSAMGREHNAAGGIDWIPMVDPVQLLSGQSFDCLVSAVTNNIPASQLCVALSGYQEGYVEPIELIPPGQQGRRMPLGIGAVNTAQISTGTGPSQIDIVHDKGDPWIITGLGVRWPATAGVEYATIKVFDSQHNRFVVDGSVTLSMLGRTHLLGGPNDFVPFATPIILRSGQRISCFVTAVGANIAANQLGIVPMGYQVYLMNQ